MDLAQRVRDLLLRPRETWPTIKSEEATVTGLYKSYALVLAIIPAAAKITGLAFIGISFIGIRYRTPFTTALADAILSYGASLAALYLIAVLMNGLAPRFASQKNLVNAFKLAIYSCTPSWVAGILLVIPSLTWLAGLASLYGFYLFYLGLPILMETPREKVPVYFLTAVVLSIIVTAFMLSVVALFFPSEALV